MDEAARTQLTARQTGGRRDPLPWIISIGAHAILVIAGFFIVWNVSIEAEPDRSPVIVSFRSPAPPPRAKPLSDAPLAAAPLAAPNSIVEETVADLGTTDLSGLVERMDPMLSAEPLLREIESIDRPIRDVDALPRVTFAGLGASDAKSIVYVVDASASMVATFPFVLNELERSVRALAPSQQFQIVFVTAEAGRSGRLAAPHPADRHARIIRLIRALPQNVEAVLRWAENVRPSGRSDPIEALGVAISFKPDAVFVLSSAISGLGEWEPQKEEILVRLDELNPRDPKTGLRPTVIKTIQILQEDPSGIIRAIGAAHGGEDGHTFLSREELFNR